MPSKKNTILILALIGIISLSFYYNKKKRGSVYALPLDKGEFVPDEVVDTTPPDYMDF
jgi:hypothetical protein